ncbi:MAG: nucleotide-binding domain-containing protein [Bacillota bacterium]
MKLQFKHQKFQADAAKESTNFFGPHYIECCIIKNGVCAATGHIGVPIGHS